MDTNLILASLMPIIVFTIKKLTSNSVASLSNGSGKIIIGLLNITVIKK